MVTRGGFTLVEVVVATTLLAVGVLTLAASGGLAAGLIRTAQREEAATRLAGTLLDSLALASQPGSGSVTSGALQAHWEIDGRTIELAVEYQDGGVQRVHRWVSQSLPRLPRLPASQAAPP